MKNNKKIIILGNGFRAMISAFLLSKKYNDISIISNTENIHGIMSPILWEGGNFDRGYQFFDGLDLDTKNILEDFVGKDILHNFGYGAATFTNNKIYEDHAIPYWPHKGLLFSLKSFFELLIMFFKKNEIKNIKSYKDLIKTIPKSIRKILEQGCQRNIGLASDKLSYLVSNFSPLLHYRQTILPDTISFYLKKNHFFEKKLACRRKKLSLDEISLYPKGKYIGYVSNIMEKKLKEIGINFIISKKSIVSKEKEVMKLKMDQNEINPDLIFMVAEMDDILNFFTEKITTNKNNHYVSQIFIYFSVENVISNYQYIHGNDTNILINRVNNLSLYGEKTSKGHNVISVEIPTKIDSEVWINTENYLTKIWYEVKKMKVVNYNENFINYKIFKIPKTICAPLLNFEDSKKKLQDFIKLNYENKIETPGLGVITRKKFIDAISQTIKKYD